MFQATSDTERSYYSPSLIFDLNLPIEKPFQWEKKPELRVSYSITSRPGFCIELLILGEVW